MAKTIWMILTNDFDCFEGQYNTDSSISLEKYDIGSFDDGLGMRSQPYFTPLDTILTNCTDHDPTKRLNAKELLEKFDEWLHINHNFHWRNNAEWEEITNKLFPINVPAKVEWTKIDDIIKILNLLCKYRSLAYVFLPSGGMHIQGAKKANEDKFIELDLGSPYLFSAKILTFYSFSDDPRWNYFRLDSNDNIYPIFESTLVKKDFRYSDEELTELSPGNYAPYEVSEYDDSYNGFSPQEGMRYVSRYFRGSMLLFNTRSSYNLESSTHDRHSFFTKKEFEFYIEGCSQGKFDLKNNNNFEEIKQLYAAIKL